MCLCFNVCVIESILITYLPSSTKWINRKQIQTVDNNRYNISYYLPKHVSHTIHSNGSIHTCMLSRKKNLKGHIICTFILLIGLDSQTIPSGVANCARPIWNLPGGDFKKKRSRHQILLKIWKKLIFKIFKDNFKDSPIKLVNETKKGSRV